MSSDTDTLSHFGALDELIQIIYQGPWRFVVLSKVEEESWTVHVGLAERCWRGIWVEKDILHVTGSKAPAKVVEGFADKLAAAFVQGELYVGNWSSEKGAEINPFLLHRYAESDVDDPCCGKRSRCRRRTANAGSTHLFTRPLGRLLHPRVPYKVRASRPRYGLSSQSTVADHKSPRRPVPRQTPAMASSSRAPAAKLASADEKLNEQDEIKKLKAELAKAQQARAKSTTPGHEPKPKPTTGAKRPPKGASLANPNKKARKYQAIEFESDEE